MDVEERPAVLDRGIADERDDLELLVENMWLVLARRGIPVRDARLAHGADAGQRGEADSLGLEPAEQRIEDRLAGGETNLVPGVEALGTAFAKSRG